MQLSQRIAGALLALLFLITTGSAALAQAVSGPVHVFICLGQSNMCGLGHVSPPSSPISLEYAVQKKHLYPFLVDSSGQWVVQKRVRLVYVMPFKANGLDKAKWDAYWKDHSLTDPLAPGMMRTINNQWMTIAKQRFIGPEYGIAHEVKKAVHGPIMILKSVIGNRSIGWDLLPPGSKGYTFTDSKGKVWQYAGYGQSPNRWLQGTTPRPFFWYAGKEYDMDVKFAQYVLANLQKYYPGATSFKVDGFFFWQGEKDLGDMAYATRYEKDLTAFIHAVRKALNAPKAPFVLGNLGEAVKGQARGTEALVLKGQLDVADPALHPEFKGNVATVYTHPLSLGGSGDGHYGGNAQTYMNVGLAMGKAMDKLLAHK